jgi:hypothetical protein
MATAAVRRGIAARQLLLVEDAPQLLVTNQRKKRRRRVHVEQQLSLRQGKEENVEGRWDGGTEKPKVGANLEGILLFH